VDLKGCSLENLDARMFGKCCCRGGWAGNRPWFFHSGVPLRLRGGDDKDLTIKRLQFKKI
jgi:hypothetical protein